MIAVAGVEYERRRPPARSPRPLPKESPEELKAQGNAWIRKNQSAKAINCYSAGLQLLDQDAELLAAHGELYTTLLTNRAQARLNLHQFQHAIKDADRAVRCSHWRRPC